MVLLKSICEKDIQIYIDTSINKYGYNLGDFLNAPYYMGLWNQNPHHSQELLERLNKMGTHYPETILGIYCKDRPNDEIVPSINRLKNSINIFLKNNSDKIKTIYDIIIKDTTLCVHLRTGDYGLVSDFFINIIYQESLKYENVILLTGIHADTSFNKLDKSKANCIISINKILSKNKNIYVYLDNPDIHLSLFSISKNILLHKGGFSILASLVSIGNIYVTEEFNALHNKNWLKEINNNLMILK